MPIVRPLLQLIRIDSSILGLLSIFLPLFNRTGNLQQSFNRALPLLFICICTFISNDLHDIERDSVNHPNRPLPSKEIRPIVATILYFVALASALFSTRNFVDETIAFWYYGLFSLSISYGLVIDHLSILKAPYVAITASIPVLIVAAWYPETRLFVVASSVFVMMLGREICMDVKDRAGDHPSVLDRINPGCLAKMGLGLQGIGLLLLTTQAKSALDVVISAAIAVLVATAAALWFKWSQYKLSIIFMKAQFFVGLYYLL